MGYCHRFRLFNRLRYFGRANCNNASDAFNYWFGWEGSHVVYIAYRTAYTTGKVLTPDWRGVEDYGLPRFAAQCMSLAESTKADECDCVRSTPDAQEWRLWWD